MRDARCEMREAETKGTMELKIGKYWQRQVSGRHGLLTGVSECEVSQLQSPQLKAVFMISDQTQAKHTPRHDQAIEALPFTITRSAHV
jgi:hypothetical protein